jgi:hypothetical protein
MNRKFISQNSVVLAHYYKCSSEAEKILECSEDGGGRFLRNADKFQYYININLLTNRFYALTLQF